MAQDPTVLLVTDSLALPASIVLWVLQEFQLNLTNGNSLALVTQASTFGGNLVLQPCSLDAVISVAETTGFHTVEWLSEIAKALRPGGCLIVQECMGRRASTSHDLHPVTGIQVAAADKAEADLQRKILLGGFIGLTKAEKLKDVEFPEVFQITHSKSSLSSLVAQPIAITAKKPLWDMGAIFVINKPVSIRDEEGVSAKAPTIDLHSDEITAKELDSAAEDGAAIWALETSNKFTDSDFIDEDALLAEEDLESPQLPSGGDDCEVGNFGRKACTKCTCGRADLEEKRMLTPEQLNNPQSACGSCGLGDAFRCNSCPYRGSPSFKLGEKIILSGSLQTVDA